EGRPGREIVAQLLQAVLDLGADGEGAMNTVRASWKRLLLVAPNARHTPATCVGVRRLRLDRLLETGLPPGIRRLRRRCEERFDRGSDRVGLVGAQLEIHGRGCQSGMFPCLRGGWRSRFVIAVRSASI